MPVLIDHEERRRQLTDAVWRVVRRQGVDSASVRTVAAEAGVSVGSLRHVFPAHPDLLAAAMGAVVERVARRVASLAPGSTARASIEQRVRQLLPLDEERRRENEVWLAFCAVALVRPDLHQLYDEVHVGLLDACRAAVTEMGVGDPATEAVRLHAVIDGLALHAAMQPAAVSSALMEAVLSAHLDTLDARRH